MWYNVFSGKGGLRVEILIIAAALLIAAILIYISYRLEQRRKKYINGIKKFAEESVCFEGTVTSVSKDYIMLKFRDEAQKKTVHHKYSYSRRRYKPEAQVTVYYDDRNDCACIEGDNPFTHKAMWCALGSALCAAAAFASAAAGIIFAVR